MQWIRFLGLALASAPYANALIRFGCSQLVTERYDPYVHFISARIHPVFTSVLQIGESRKSFTSSSPNRRRSKLPSCSITLIPLSSRPFFHYRFRRTRQ